MPLPQIYDVIIPLIIIIPMGFVFFSSALLYNSLCRKNLLSADESAQCVPLKKAREYFFVFAVAMAISVLFYWLISNDGFDLSLFFFVPPIAVSVLCRLKNGFVPIVSVVFCAFCVLGRIVFYCIFQGVGFGLSIVLSFLLALGLILIPKLVFRKGHDENIDLPLILTLSLMASYFSPIYSVIYLFAVCLFIIILYVIPNFISEKRRGNPIFTFEVPILAISSAVFAAMLLI
ncbi:MAG: hypothetical protein IJP09_01975 [Clostridia bacterium]|nr:hypothetical protein [Clostridia bacterium]